MSLASLGGNYPASAVKKEKTEKERDAKDLPLTPLLEELGFVRKAFHDLASNYVSRIEGELEMFREVVVTIGSRKKVSTKCAKGLSEVLLLLRSFEMKPEKGRRRDLKKVEALVEEIRRIADDWE